MKQLRLVFASLAITAAAVWAIAAVASDQKSATAANGACTPMTSAECKARMAAGQTCPMHGASATSASTAAAGECSAHSMKTAAAGQTCSKHGATTTAMTDCCVSGAKASAVTASATADPCAGHGASAVSAKNAASCPMHGATAATAAGHDGCSMKNRTGTTAANGHGMCPEHDVSAMAAGLGSNCGGHEKSAGATAHLDCDACDDLASCDAELQAAGASMQTVPIKNGVMFVYTAGAPGRVNAIQSVMARRTEHLSRIVTAGTGARLCDDCKSMRGAMASGHLVREIVNIEGGTLVLVTSDDPKLVKRIRDLADAGKTAVKS